jgi:CBS domain-containing protein
MTVTNLARSITGGVDTHLDVHVAAALDERGALLGVESFATTESGYKKLLGWLADFGPVELVGIEGTGSYGAGLTRHLQAERIRVVEVDRPNRQRSRSGVRRALDQSGISAAPVVDQERFEGTVALSGLEASGDGEQAVGEFVDAGAPTVAGTSRLDVALESLTAASQSWVPVLDDERRVIGTLSISDVVRAYRQELVTSAERMSDLGVTTGATQVTVTADSTVVGKTLRHAELPPGLLVTSISRDDKVLYPDGETTLEVGDQLTVIGSGPDPSRIGEIASTRRSGR